LALATSLCSWALGFDLVIISLFLSVNVDSDMW
jgi:hypothetical protein